MWWGLPNKITVIYFLVRLKKQHLLCASDVFVYFGFLFKTLSKFCFKLALIRRCCNLFLKYHKHWERFHRKNYEKINTLVREKNTFPCQYFEFTFRYRWNTAFFPYYQELDIFTSPRNRFNTPSEQCVRKKICKIEWKREKNSRSLISYLPYIAWHFHL